MLSVLSCYWEFVSDKLSVIEADVLLFLLTPAKCLDVCSCLHLSRCLTKAEKNTLSMREVGEVEGNMTNLEEKPFCALWLSIKKPLKTKSKQILKEQIVWAEVSLTCPKCRNYLSGYDVKDGRWWAEFEYKKAGADNFPWKQRWQGAKKLAGSRRPWLRHCVVSQGRFVQLDSKSE